MQNKKLTSIILIVIISIISPILTVISIDIYSSLREDFYEGIKISIELGDLKDSIEVLNPKGYYVLYKDDDSILLNYRTAQNVSTTEYVLDGLTPQPIPATNIIPKPEVGNHSLVLLGINRTGETCNSTKVYFYISNKPPGILGTAPEVTDKTDKGFVSIVLYSGIEMGIKASLPFTTQIFLKGPQRTNLDRSFTNVPYTKNIDLNFETLTVYIPLMISRSESWYNHSIHVTSSCGWIEHVKDGDVVVIYFSTHLFHLFGSVSYWNDETRKYDTVVVESIDFCNIYSMKYNSNESILEMPLYQNITYEAGLDGKPTEYNDKSVAHGSEIGDWSKERDWIEDQEYEGEVFLGYYNHDEFSPVPIRFLFPRLFKSVEELIPNTIQHVFTRTYEDPDNYNYNYRGYENIFSYNLYSI
ncbi:MAG: hypothetical protein ACFFE4_13075 [Candidatus Thorarchaeota archaeon]